MDWVVCYLSRFEYFRYRYNACNPAPIKIKSTPKANNTPSAFGVLEMIMQASPLTMQTAGTLLAKTLKLKFIGNIINGQSTKCKQNPSSNAVRIPSGRLRYQLLESARSSILLIS